MIVTSDYWRTLMTIFEKFKKNPDPDFLPMYQCVQPPRVRFASSSRKLSPNLKSEQIGAKVRRFGFSRRVKVYDLFLDLNKYIASTCFTTHSIEKRVSGSISI
jgi:hypothetical protein